MNWNCVALRIIKRLSSFQVLIAAILLWVATISLHPFYVGLTEVEYNKKTKVLQISIKLFVDDVMSEINKTAPNSFNPESKNTLANKKCLEQFVNNNFTVKCGSEERKMAKTVVLPLNFIGWELEENAVWMYLEAYPTQRKCIEINNQLLCNSLNSQIHIVKIIDEKVLKTERLTCAKPILLFCQ